MALSNLEQALIERLQSSEHIYNGLINAAYIVHEITRIHAPDTETPEDYIRRAVQETFDNQYQAGITYAANIVYGASLFDFSKEPESSAAYIQRVVTELRNLAKDPSMGLELAVEAYKQYSGFQFNHQSGRPTDYLIEMAKRHKQLFEAPTAVDTQPGIEQAAMLISSRAAMPLLPGESCGDFLARMADKLHGSYAQGMACVVNELRGASGIRFINNESNDDYIRRVGEIAKRASETKRAPFTELFELIFDLSGVKPEIKLEDFKENAYEYLTQIAELINKSKKA